VGLSTLLCPLFRKKERKKEKGEKTLVRKGKF
jgi:hypothetical protein